MRKKKEKTKKRKGKKGMIKVTKEVGVKGRRILRFPRPFHAHVNFQRAPPAAVACDQGDTHTRSGPRSPKKSLRAVGSLLPHLPMVGQAHEGKQRASDEKTSKW